MKTVIENPPELSDSVYQSVAKIVGVQELPEQIKSVFNRERKGYGITHFMALAGFKGNPVGYVLYRREKLMSLAGMTKMTEAIFPDFKPLLDMAKRTEIVQPPKTGTILDLRLAANASEKESLRHALLKHAAQHFKQMGCKDMMATFRYENEEIWKDCYANGVRLTIEQPDRNGVRHVTCQWPDFSAFE